MAALGDPAARILAFDFGTSGVTVNLAVSTAQATGGSGSDTLTSTIPWSVSGTSVEGVLAYSQ